MTESAPSSERTLWKDVVNRNFVVRIAEAIARFDKSFERDRFVKTTIAGDFSGKELKEKIEHIAAALKSFLPSNYKRATTIVVKAAPLLGEFENWVLTDYVRLFGQDDFDHSMQALKDLTRYGTSEFAIRPFVVDHTDQALELFAVWVADPNEHVRRLAAEATRPRGVWVAYVPSFIDDPRPVLDILEELKADRSLYVRKAVANNLNDISKDHPDLVVRTAKRWKKDSNKLTDWIIKHGCRSLIKKGDRKAMALFGFVSSPKLEVAAFKVSPARLKIGADVTMTVRLKSLAARSQKLVIDYRVYYLRPSGKTSTKVFKWSVKQLAPGETLDLKRNHSFLQRNTRTHYPGRHRMELIINGRVFGDAGVHLRK